DVTDVSNLQSFPLAHAVAPLPAGFKRFRARLADDQNLFAAGARVGDVVTYRGTDGRRYRAVIDEMKLRTVWFRFDGGKQVVPATDDARLLSLFDAGDENRLSPRTEVPNKAISFEVSTVQVTGTSDAPPAGNLDTPLSFTVVIDGSSTPIAIAVDQLSDNRLLEDLAADLNAAFAAK